MLHPLQVPHQVIAHARHLTIAAAEHIADESLEVPNQVGVAQVALSEHAMGKSECG